MEKFDDYIYKSIEVEKKKDDEYINRAKKIYRNQMDKTEKNYKLMKRSRSIELMGSIFIFTLKI